MLVAPDEVNECRVVLPAIRDPAERAVVRQRTRKGELTCRECKALLNYREGSKRRPHFAHRTLVDCPLKNIAAVVLEACSLPFPFFQSGIGDKISGVEVEPDIPGIPDGARADLLVCRHNRRDVAIMFIEKNLKPETRERLASFFDQRGYEFRPVFLPTPTRPARGYLGNTVR
jgi:hypothetical protein